MAKFNTVGFDDIEKQFLRQSEKATKAIPQMLEIGASILVDAQKAEAKALNIEDSGDFIKSIKASKIKNTSFNSTVIVSPTGKNHKGIRNSEVGFVNEYGTSKIAARAWQEKANAKSEEKIHKAMLEVWDGINNDD